MRIVVHFCALLSMVHLLEAAPVDLFDRYCFDCHDDTQAEAELDLYTFFKQPAADPRGGRTLRHVILSLEHSEMPPPKAKRKPTATERQKMIEFALSIRQRIANEQKDDPGHVVMARLTPHQYRNVIRDLSGGVVTDAGRFLPNEGGAGEGFSNVGEAQSMTPAQLEKYLDAAKDVLAHLRVSPVLGMTWSRYPRNPNHEPRLARQEAVNEIIEWYVGQQQKWGEEHRDALNQRFGFVHTAYLYSAWRYQHRSDRSTGFDRFAELDGFNLSTVILEKWWKILSAENPQPPFVAWAKAWQQLPSEASRQRIIDECQSIVMGKKSGILVADAEDFAPSFEISYHEAKEEVLAAAAEGYWPFRIEIRDAKELFLIVSDAGDGNRGETGRWRSGRIVFRDGTSKPWQDVVQLRGARSGRDYAFGKHYDTGKTIGPDEVGVRPPGGLKFQVPEDALVFEVEMALDERSRGRSSVQALILDFYPKRTSFIARRPVFGGKPRNASAQESQGKELARALRKRNLSEANKTKIGLNAERNVFADWTRTGIEDIGGPWPDHSLDKDEPGFPYYLTVKQVLANATTEDLAEVRGLEDHLFAIAQTEHQALLRIYRNAGVTGAKEGVLVRGIDSSDLAQRVYRRNMALEQSFVQMLKGFAEQAWRRPLPDTALEPLVEIYRNSRTRGFSHDGAAKGSLLAVLASPDFLYPRGRLGKVTAQQLDARELSNRLSFFLWGSIPDPELIERSRSGQLKDVSVLRSQARRMLQDERARSLATDFAAQLWQFAGFEEFNGPDSKRFAAFTPGIRSAMLAETTEFIADLLMNDGSLENLLSADYTFVNADLARFYGLEKISGDQMRRVPTPPERGGLITMGLFLTKASLPLRTSPVQRGTWIYRDVLGRGLPAPPPNVPELSEDETNDKGQTVREQLEIHRADPNCASCHARIDPPGIALEAYDPIGRIRDGQETEAITHDRVVLRGVNGLKEYLRAHRDEFFAHFNRKLLGYALGRAVQLGDEALLNRMNRRLQSNGYRFSALVEEIVTSRQFRFRRTTEIAKN